MKKAKIIWLIVAGALMFVGFVGFVVAMSLNNWNFGMLSTQKYETHEYAIDESFTDIVIDSVISDVSFVPADIDDMRVVVDESDKIKYSVSVNGGVLEVKCEDTRKWFDFIGIFTNSPSLTVYMPAGEYGKLFVHSNTGKIEISSKFGFQDAEIRTNTGNIEYYANTAEDIKINSDTGSVIVTDIVAKNIDIEVATGKINMRNCDFSGDARIEVSTGNMEITSVDCNNFITEGDTGKVYLNLVIAANRMDIERDTGDVIFTMCEAAQIHIETDTGDVDGSFLSDKTVIAHSDTGKVNVPATSGGRCEIETDTGDIRIEIRD